jgi:hypothetical protein
MLALVFIVPGLIMGYALVLRPLLRKVPALQASYAEADGFWAKVWAYCGKSVTVTWGYLLGGIGSAMAMLDPLANAVGDPDLKDKVAALLQSNPQVLGYLTIGISVITIAARLRSIAKGA